MLEFGTVNLVQVLFALMTLCIVTIGTCINLWEKYMPDSMKQSFRYGKIAFRGATSSRLVAMTEVPKSYFQHFYIYSALLMLWIFSLTVAVYMYEINVPPSFHAFLDVIGGGKRIARVSPVHVLLAEFLLTIQCVKRFYDSNFISVFSATSRMNLTHYAAGFIHYTGCALAFILEAPLFTNHLDDNKAFQYPGMGDVIASVIFLWACYKQLEVAIILANLRKDKQGKIISQKHLIPESGLFKYLSSPHMNCEIIMYTCLTYILLGNQTWLCIYAWVLTNQIEVILLNHWWYQKTFPNFPKERKALVPCIY